MHRPSDAYKNRDLARRVVEKIKDIAPKETVKLCHVCGTHEWTITHGGIRNLLPETVELIAGPGCPVCIVPAREIDEAVWLAENDVTVVTFGDMFRDPGSEKSLEDAKSKGADVRVIYSVRDLLDMASNEPEKNFVFFAIGFETTVPMNAVVIPESPENLSYLISHRVIPPAMDFLLALEDLNVNGFIAPGHVSTIIGEKAYEKYPAEYGVPTVIAGFEPMDMLMSVYMLLKQLDEGKPLLENEYKRAVSYDGNLKAQKIIDDTFEIVDGSWRGIGVIPDSTLQLREKYRDMDARVKYDIPIGPGRDIYPGCSCHLVIVGKINPDQCPLFNKACTPESPKGACMVSVEGTCRIWASHGGHEPL